MVDLEQIGYGGSDLLCRGASWWLASACTGDHGWSGSATAKHLRGEAILAVGCLCDAMRCAGEKEGRQTDEYTNKIPQVYVDFCLKGKKKNKEEEEAIRRAVVGTNVSTQVEDANGMNSMVTRFN